MYNFVKPNEHHVAQTKELSVEEIDLVSGAGNIYAGYAAGFTAASVASRGLALIPSPASPALAAFSVVTGGLAAAFAIVAASTGPGGSDTHISNGTKVMKH